MNETKYFLPSVVFVFVYIAFIVNLFIKKKKMGDELIALKRRLGFEGWLLLVLILLIVIFFKRIGDPVVGVLVLALILLNLYLVLQKRIIWEHGILDIRIWKWDEIKSYRWEKSNLFLEVSNKRCLQKGYYEKKWVIPCSKKDYVDNILSKHINNDNV